jgi:outer membrane protein assembly factor BamB/tetratricopeptide (TPR) repeat protein
MNSAAAPLARLLALLLAVSWVGHCAAQQGRFGIGLQLNMSRFIPPPRSVNQQLKDAEEAIAEQRYSEAVVILGDLVERNLDPNEDPSIAGQDFFLDINDSDQQRLDTSFLRRCRSLIGTLPVAALETYELRYGALAQQLLDAGSEDRDWNRLREVRRKYFHTKAGYYASYLLAQRELFLGHPLAASLLLDDVVTSQRAINEVGQQLSVMHAVASRLSGRSLARDLASTGIPITVGEETAAEEIKDWRKWIDEHYVLSAADSISHSRDYPLLGGDTSRNETAEGQLPLSTPRWMLETTATPLEEQMLRRKSNDLTSSGRLVPPSWSPIRVGGQLLMRTTERLRGVDYRTGKRVWQYPWFQTDDGAENEQSISLLGGSSSSPIDRLSRRVWNDLPYGQITSDGKHVYLLDDLSPFQMIPINPLMGVRNTRPVAFGRNTLVALELETEGKTLWRLGQNPTIESQLNEAFFLGAPISVDGSLYAMVEIAGDVLLVCLEPATGKLLWRQQLVAVEGASIQNDPMRRIAGAMPSYHQGVLICPTGAGATIAIDLADRTLRWGNSYPRRARGSNTMFGQSVPGGGSSDQYLERWHNAAATASGTSVLVTPVATDNLYCYDIVDGKKRFSKTRNDAFYVAGIRSGRLLIVGSREISSFDMENGRLSWKTDQRMISAGHQVIGRGVFGPDCYIVPTSGNELIKVSLVDGRAVQRRTTRFPLGNLIAVDGEIISQGPTQLAVALGARTLGPRVERMLKEDPDNLDALIQKALLLSEKGERQEALELLQRARKIDPDSDDVLMLSISSMLGELRDNPSPPEGLEAELEALIDTPAQRLEFLALRIQSAVRNQSVEPAVSRLLEFSKVMTDMSPIGNENDSILRDPTRDCSLDSWMAARAAEIVRLASETGQLEIIRKKVAEHLESRPSESTKVLMAMAEQLHPLGIDDVIVSLGERLVAEGELFNAERVLLGAIRPSRLLDQSELVYSADRVAELAKVYGKGGFYADWAALNQVVDQAIQDDPATELSVNREQMKTEVQEGLVESSLQLDVTGSVSLTWKSIASTRMSGSAGSPKMVRPSLEAGRSFKGWAVVNNPASAQLLDPDGSDYQLPMDEYRSNRNSDRKAVLNGGMMILERPGRISAIDLFAMKANQRGDALLWSRDFGSDGVTATPRKSYTTVFGDSNFSYPTSSATGNVLSEFRVGPVLGDRVLVLQAGDLLAIDSTNGETMWRNSDAPPIGRIVVDKGRVAVVSYRKGIVASVTQFDLLDGRKYETSDWQYGEAWATSGKHVLAYEVNENVTEATVRLVDPFNDDVKLEIEAPVKQPLRNGSVKGMGRILQNRYLVLLDATGRLVIWDLMEGVELGRHEVGEMPTLQEMHAVWMEGQILVFPSYRSARKKGDKVTQEGEVHKTLHKIIAVSTESGEINWVRDFEDPWGVTIDQPYGSPVLLLVRSRTIYTVNRSTPKMDVAMIRMTDGETIHLELDKEVSPRSTRLTTTLRSQPALGRIQAVIEGEVLIYVFGPSGDPIQQPDE